MLRFKLLCSCLPLLTYLAMAPPLWAGSHTSLDHGLIARTALAKHIQPGYSELAAAFDRFHHSTQKKCAPPATLDLPELRGSFEHAAMAWGRIAHIQFGPVRKNNRYERIWFWPDRKSIAQRQVLKALRKQHPDYTDAEKLVKKSIAVQGLTAAQYILYSDRSPLKKPDEKGRIFACSLLKAITANLVTIARNVQRDWRDDGAYGRLWLSPGPTNRAYLKPGETTFALLKSLSIGLEKLRDAELSRPLGMTAARRPMPGPFAISRLTMRYIAARIAGLRAAFEMTQLCSEMLALAERTGDEQAAQEIQQALFELKLLAARSKALAKHQDPFAKDAGQRNQLIALGFPLKSARGAMLSAAGRLTKLPVGFNASDGD